MLELHSCSLRFRGYLLQVIAQRLHGTILGAEALLGDLRSQHTTIVYGGVADQDDRGG